jgi:hypothetical protein
MPVGIDQSARQLEQLGAIGMVEPLRAISMCCF